MRAALFTGTDQPLSIEDVTPSPPGPRDVVVEIGASGVCHSDVSLVHGYLPLPPPIIGGHEGTGRVVEIGNEVTRVQVGDRVVASFVPACGTCWYCLHAQSNLCEYEIPALLAPRAERTGGEVCTAFTGLGTFAEMMTVNEASIVKIESDLPDAQLALIGCAVTTGVGAALNTAKVEPGASVAVIGCGGVGQAVVQGARIAGAARIIAIDPVGLKRDAALKVGATDVIDPADGDPLIQVMALTGGRGADYAFEVIGLPETITQAYAMARKGGTAIVVGMARADAQVTLSPFEMFFAEKRLVASKYGSAQVRRDFQRFVDLIEAGRLDTESMVSRTIGLDGVNNAFRAMEAGEVIRSVIV